MNPYHPIFDDLDAARSDDCHMTEQRLLSAAQAGDERAFLELCRSSSRQVLRSINRITRNKHDSEDVLQESLMKAFVHLSRFDARSSFATWLTRIGINSALQLLRKRKKSLEIPVERSLDGGDTWEDRDIPDTSLDPEARYMAFEQSVRLQKAIRGLPMALRCVVRTRHSENCSMQELADTVGISVPAAKSRLVRARAALGKALVLSTPRC
ncbi:RNA polymerase sigma-70 factor (ECF subfamily) [Silvibacterium bohemicum]|uniref:RNA polymerase sigma factor n=1 Tax=Silvibacterium bohemicum TaxID=1577686 RepID=A0A841JSU1_9BACT|nr:sigma-70 family RNA polymerase sigma factor [Silvibacterium bohemicum]MBB6144482.1 RNA polymerase sigma-70 factor (ECF subfamily) [Silvibacterium bohemicum]